MTEPLDKSTDAEIIEATKYANRLMDSLHDTLFAGDLDPTIVVYALWRNMTAVLAVNGWSADGLCADVQEDVLSATTEGSMH